MTTYDQAFSHQRDPFIREHSDNEVVCLELWDDCLLAVTRGAGSARLSRDTWREIFPHGKALVRSGPCPVKQSTMR